MRVILIPLLGAGAVATVVIASVRAMALVADHGYRELGLRRLAVLTVGDEIQSASITYVFIVVFVLAEWTIFGAVTMLLTKRLGTVVSCLIGAGMAVVLVGLGTNAHMNNAPWEWPDLGVNLLIVMTGLLLVGTSLTTRAPKSSWAPLRFVRVVKWSGALAVSSIVLLNGMMLFVQRANRPVSSSVIFIMVDTLRRDYVGAYNGQRDATPHIDALAASGTRYTACYAQAPSTKPSVASIFTSRYVSEHGAVDNYARLPIAAVTLAEVLRNEGYATGAFVENPVIRRPFQYDQGFKDWEEDLARVYVSQDNQSDFDKKIQRWIARSKNKPFFLYVHYLDPHCPYDAPPPYFRAREVDGNPIGPIETRELEPINFRDQPDRLDLVRARYREEIRFVDDRIGKLLAELDTHPLLRDSIVVLVSDHGEGFLERDQLQHSYGTYAELVNVPLIVRDGANRESKTDDSIVQHVDLAPMLLNRLGIDAAVMKPSGLSQIARERTAPVILEHLRTTSGERQRAIVEGHWKLIHHLDTGRFELFDQRDEGLDREDVSGAQSAITERLATTLNGWVANVGGLVAAPVVEDDESINEQLDALGYL